MCILSSQKVFKVASLLASAEEAESSKETQEECDSAGVETCSECFRITFRISSFCICVNW